MQVKSPDEGDYKKLSQCLWYLLDNADLPLTLEADGTNIIYWWIDVSHVVHPDMQSHTSATMTLVKGAIQPMSLKQSINT